MNLTHRILLIFISLSQLISAQTIKVEDAVKNFDLIELQDRFIENLGTLGSDGQKGAYNLPIGIKKIIGNISFTLAITNIKFGDHYGEATIYVKMRHPQKTLMFGATDVKITHQGDLEGNVKLALLSNVPIPVGKLGNVVLKGNFDKSTGTGTSDTYILLDCNGDIQKISVDGELVLNSETFRSLDKKDSIVRSPFHIDINDWNDLMVQTKLPAFEIKTAEGFEFNAQNITLDLSDLKNPEGFDPNDAYLTEHCMLPDKNLWRGLYASNISVTFPQQFKNTKTNQRIKVEVPKLLIDENGVTVDVTGKDILSIEAGNASGWAFSVSDFELSLVANNITKFGFGGKINIPISNQQQLRPYKAAVFKGGVLLNVSLGEELNCDIFGACRATIFSSSSVELKLKDGQFCPKIIMDGYMPVNVGGLKMEKISFRELSIASYAPYLQAKSISYDGKIELNNFPISADSIVATTTDSILTLGFGMKVNLMSGKIAASTRAELASSYKDGHWKFKGFSINKLKLEDTQLAGFELSGEIGMEKNHPIYGDYFGGMIDATFSSLSKGLNIKVASVFGSKDFRYWYVEGSATFPAGIPVGAVKIDGFTGGAYYRMKHTGKSGIEAYAPDDKTSLGVKAGVNYSIGDKSTINGDALFEMSFLPTGGVKHMKFYAKANFLNAKAKLGKTDEIFSKMQIANTDPSKELTEELPDGLDSSDAAKELMTKTAGAPAKETESISAFATMSYDFPDKTFDAKFSVRVDVAGGLLKGTGPDNEAGSAHLYISPQKWFVKIGTPTKTIGLQFGLGALSIKTQSYFMFGDIDESARPPRKEVLDILKITPEDPDFMKFPQMTKTGKGVAFGNHVNFDTGDITFLILYARFAAGAGIDLMVQDKTGYICDETKQLIKGMNGWFAMGQCYAYLQGELGINIKLLFIRKKVTVIKGATAALLQASLPAPTWIGGQFAVEIDVLSIIKARMKMKMSFGDKCTPVSTDGTASPLDFPILADLSPSDQATEIDVFTSPQATLNLPVGTQIVTEDDHGNAKTFRVKLNEFYIADANGNKLEGTERWNSSNDVVTFRPRSVLPPKVKVKATVSVIFEEYVSGNWQVYTHNGTTAREEKITTFQTGDAPMYIPHQNIEYLYPVADQKNLFLGESSVGYLQLIQAQDYLFPANFNYNVVFTDADGQVTKAPFKYNKAEMNINFALPQLVKSKDYKVAYVASSNITSTQGQNQIKSTSQEIKDESGETYSIALDQKVAQEIIKEGGLSVLDFNARTSAHHTLADKLAKMTLTPSQLYINEDVRVLYLKTEQPHELFDLVELVGNEFTSDQPMIQPEAMLTDKYYTQDMAPLLYKPYPIAPGMHITKRDTEIFGAPPTKAITHYDGYVSTIAANNYDVSIATTFPYVYSLPFIYFQDYHELHSKALNLFYTNAVPGYTGKLELLIKSGFGFIRQGKYKVKFKYVLPGDKPAKTVNKEIDFVNTLDWRP